MYKNLVQGTDANMSDAAGVKIEPYPLDQVTDKSLMSDDERSKLHEAGLEVIKAGRACVVILAGG